MRWTDEMKEFLWANYKGRGNQELANLFNERFGTDVTAAKMKAYKKNHKLNSGLTGYFPKGNVPINKGKKGMFGFHGNKTSFKPGQLPPSTAPIGTEKVLSDGYAWVKINQYPKAKRCVNWRQKHRIIYEEHYGPIPLNHYVVFLDGNRSNFDINNLECISKREMLYLNKLGFEFSNQELSRTAIQMARMVTTANLKKRCMKARKSGEENEAE